MDHNSEFEDVTDPQLSGRTEKLITQASQSLKLQDRFRLDRPSLSYADFHHKITKNADARAPQFSVNSQKMEKKKVGEDDELVKYMSYLPSYLQRGETPQEKALNIGVLNWVRLENWQHNLKQVPRRNGTYSPSSSNTSSFFSNDGPLTNYSGSGQSCSPSCQNMQRFTLWSHLEGSSQGIKSFGGNFHDLETPQTEILNRLKSKSKMDTPSGRSNSVVMLDGSMKNKPDLNIAAKRVSSSHIQYEAVSCSNEVVKGRNDKFAKEADKSESFTDGDIFDKQSRAVFLLPRDTSQTSSSVTQPSGSAVAIKDKTLTGAKRRNSTENFTFTAVHSLGIQSNNSRSCQLACEAVNNDHEHVQHHSMSDKSDESSSGASLPPSSVKVITKPSKSRKAKEKSTRLPIDSTAINPSQEFDQKTNKLLPSKVKYPSPTRRLFSIGMSRISKSLNSKEDPDVKSSGSCSTHAPAGPDNERNVTSECSSDNQNPIMRTKSSPLRRLLDPLLKPNVSDSRESLEKCGSSDGQLEHSSVHRGKVKLDSNRNEKDGPQIVQALLQVATKNGLPLFTFAVDNNKGVLAATVKNLSSPIKNDHSRIFTFFTIHEVKKKIWKKQGGKGRDYIPNVVAQMKVSDYQSKERFKMREFVLFGVELRHEEEQNSELQPNDELAAIVMKIPNETTASASVIKDRRGSDSCCKSSLKKDQHYHTVVGSEDHYTTKIILPSGVHSVSRKGEPASLIERWISGGVCDCGGWDLGCKLRVLGDGNQLDKNLSSSRKCLTREKFMLYDQEGVQENQPLFSLAPFRDGIYSAAFSPSLSHVQAFSICISALEGGKLPGISYSNSKELLQEKSFDDTTSPLENDGIKILNGIDAEVPMRHVSYPPPLSPVGRV